MKSKLVIPLFFLLIVLLRFGCSYKLAARHELSNGLYIETYKFYRFNDFTGAYKKYLSDTLEYRRYLWRQGDHNKTYCKRIDSNIFVVYNLDMTSLNYQGVLDSVVVDVNEIRKDKRWDWLHNPF